MSKDRSIYNDEIDLFELFETLREGRRLITAFTLISLLVGAGFIEYKDPKYQSKLFYSINIIPPFYSKESALSDFKQKFYSKSTFEAWKKSISKTSLVYKDFNDTEVIDGFIFTKKEDEKMVKMVPQKKVGQYISVNSNQSNILSDFYKYSTYINKILKVEYNLRANEELEIIDSRFKDISLADSDVIDTVLSIDRFINLSKNGANAIEISYPTSPEKISPNIPLVLLLASVFGVIIGFIFALLRNKVRKLKNR